MEAEPKVLMRAIGQERQKDKWIAQEQPEKLNVRAAFYKGRLKVRASRPKKIDKRSHYLFGILYIFCHILSHFTSLPNWVLHYWFSWLSPDQLTTSQAWSRIRIIRGYPRTDTDISLKFGADTDGYEPSTDTDGYGNLYPLPCLPGSD